MNETTSLYPALAAPFDHVFQDTRGGVELSYVTGEQVVSRLNEVLGYDGWEFTVREHGHHAEADELWALGELTVFTGARPVRRMQFGSQKIKRRRTDAQPLDIGFDLKGAATDALKKCASLVGVGLYLSAKEGGVSAEEQATQGAVPPAQLATIRQHLRRTGIGEPAVCAGQGVARLEDLRPNQASQLLQYLSRQPNVA